MFKKLDQKILCSTLLVLLFVLLEVSKFFNPQSIYSAVIIGQNFINRGNYSSLISAQSKYATTKDGYDGQFFYYIALDPTKAYYYIDDPAYRYQRIVYPALARLLSLGNLEAIPYLLLTINILAITTAVVILGMWLKKKEISPYFSLIYGFYPGLHFSLQRDLSEPLAYLLTILGIYIYSLKWKKYYLLMGIIFGLAILTREMIILFPLSFWLWDGISYLRQKNIRQISLLTLSVTLTITPFMLYKIFLISGAHFGSQYQLSYLFASFPFGGIVHNLQYSWQTLLQIVSVILPALLMGVVGGYLLIKHQFNQYILALFLNILFLVVFLGPYSYIEYISSGRISTGVVLASLLCLPALVRLPKKLWLLFPLTVVFWLSAWKLMAILPPFRLNLLIPFIALLWSLSVLSKSKLTNTNHEK